MRLANVIVESGGNPLLCLSWVKSIRNPEAQPLRWRFRLLGHAVKRGSPPLPITGWSFHHRHRQHPGWKQSSMRTSWRRIPPFDPVLCGIGPRERHRQCVGPSTSQNYIVLRRHSSCPTRQSAAFVRKSSPSSACSSPSSSTACLNAKRPVAHGQMQLMVSIKLLLQRFIRL